jgi:hypothetical protein
MSHFPCTNIIVSPTEIFEGTVPVPSKYSMFPQIKNNVGMCCNGRGENCFIPQGYPNVTDHETIAISSKILLTIK